MAYRDILHIMDQYLFWENTFCNNTELARPPDADNPSATKDFPPYVQTVYSQPDKSSLHLLILCFRAS